MKTKFINFAATILIALILAQALPWWSVMISAFITAIVISLKRSGVFFIPFFAIAIYWFVQVFYLSSSNDFIMAEKIALLLPLNGNVFLLMLVTAVIGGVAAGVSAVFGKQCLLVYTKLKESKK